MGAPATIRDAGQTPQAKPLVLVVDDDTVTCYLMMQALLRGGFQVAATSDPTEALQLADRRRPDFAILDIQLPGTDGFALLGALSERCPGLPVVLVTAFGSVESAVEAVTSGVVDYVSKPIDFDKLVATVRRTLTEPRAEPSDTPPEPEEAEVLVGRSPAMVEIYKTIARVAGGPATVLIQGDSGTGKELVARAIHRHGGTRTGSFVVVDCAALPEHLLEAELFGYVRGAFTGAQQDHPGLFAAADGGTILLDEIGEMPLTLQAKLLRVLQEQQIRPVGATRWRPVTVRVLVATNRDLAAEVRAGRFREDLYYRLKVVTITLPRLRDRREDIPLLCDYILRRQCRRHRRPPMTLTDAVRARLQAYDWPGNVRELAHLLERGVALSRGTAIGLEDLPHEFQPAPMSTGATDLITDRPSLEELKRRYVTMVFQENGGNVMRTAAVLGVDRRSFYRTLQAYGLIRERTGGSGS